MYFLLWIFGFVLSKTGKLKIKLFGNGTCYCAFLKNTKFYQNHVGRFIKKQN